MQAAEGPAQLRDLEAHGADLLLTCEATRCGRIVEVPLERAIERYGRDKAVPAIRARCAECGSRNVEVRPRWRMSPGVVTNHTETPDPEGLDVE